MWAKQRALLVINKWEWRVIEISRSLILSKTLMNFGGLEGPVSQIHSHNLYMGALGIFSDLLRSVQMLKREWGVESNGKLLHLFILRKTATLVPEFVVEDLPLCRTAALVSEFAVKDLPLGRTLWWWWWWWCWWWWWWWWINKKDTHWLLRVDSQWIRCCHWILGCIASGITYYHYYQYVSYNVQGDQTSGFWRTCPPFLVLSSAFTYLLKCPAF